MWAAIKPWVGKWVDVSLLSGVLRFGGPADEYALQSARQRSSYIPVAGHGDS